MKHLVLSALLVLACLSACNNDPDPMASSTTDSQTQSSQFLGD